MKFGRKIKSSAYAEWKVKYINYDALKQMLKEKTQSGPWTDGDEAEFTHALELELEKIHVFQREKAAELSERINEAEASVRRLVADYEEEADGHEHPNVPTSANNVHGDVEAAIHSNVVSASDDAGSDDDIDDTGSDGYSVDALVEQFRVLEEEVAILVADIHDLALYTKLNFTGFIKIVKKHDKKTKRSLKATFVQDYLDKRPFYKFNYDSIIVKLSNLYNLVRTRGHPVEGDASAGGSQSAFVRQTTKYWVHPDNLVHLKLAILRQLPVLVFNPDKEYELKDSAISSIYFDNEDLDLYLGRLEKTEGAEAIRLRWYGDTDVKLVFVERKTHREDWTGEKSVKARFPIKEDKVNAFLRGDYTMDDEFDELLRKGKKKESEVENTKQLANEVQYAIYTRRLRPVMRTFYNRTAFQLPGDARVRISLDTELTMVREDNWDGKRRAGDNWRRTDIGIDYPFLQLEPGDVERFPYGVLEVKLQTQLGQEPPDWVRELVSSHLVEAIPKFSKFIHGCSTLLPDRVDLVPFWLPQMDTDIRKPDRGAMLIERPQSSHTPTTSSQSPQLETPAAADQDEPVFGSYTEPVSEGEEDENMDLAVPLDEARRMQLPDAQVAEAQQFREAVLRKEAEARLKDGKKKAKDFAVANGEGDDGSDERVPYLRRRSSVPAERPKGLSIDPLAPALTFDQSFWSKLKPKVNGALKIQDTTIVEDDERAPLQEEDLAPDQRILVQDFRAEEGKKIAVPVRIEPKVIFANERTFLRWTHFSVLVGSIATTLLNFVDPNDGIGLLSAGTFTFAALLSVAYSCSIFVFRAYSMRKHHAEGWYYDEYGPTILCAVLIVCIGVNFALRWREVATGANINLF
ncbi:SPX-domain-containing protein [Cantharellus anzutake]|uniref:SPX-domain-containing protein n=1 Tax=Cantharellus anzutake TaxID=1750568 RepID=UPI00190667CA|nr:SPX-domain-containing protein [Cantharellus anzutake]KAF8340303.1 SPX-domain-containing protein [Cantharellus anzutake]